MIWFNVHRVTSDRIERMINDHVRKGYELHYIRNIGGWSPKGSTPGQPQSAVQLVFKKYIPVPEDWEAKFEKRYGKPAPKENGEGQTITDHPALPVEVIK